MDRSTLSPPPTITCEAYWSMTPRAFARWQKRGWLPNPTSFKLVLNDLAGCPLAVRCASISPIAAPTLRAGRAAIVSTGRISPAIQLWGPPSGRRSGMLWSSQMPHRLSSATQACWRASTTTRGILRQDGDPYAIAVAARFCGFAVTKQDHPENCEAGKTVKLATGFGAAGQELPPTLRKEGVAVHGRRRD